MLNIIILDFGKKEFLMPVIYSMAKKICTAQQKALKQGNSLIIYEAFRPYAVQQKVSNSLKTLSESDQEVYNGIYVSGWGEGWFIAKKLSNHQRGVAIDVSLAKINSSQISHIGNYSYTKISDYTEYTMPTQMHELSIIATTFKYGVSSLSKTDWQNVPLSDYMNENSILLQKYCTDSGLSPLASEWWHFNDLDAREQTKNNYSNGQYYITNCYSAIPE